MIPIDAKSECQQTNGIKGGVGGGEDGGVGLLCVCVPPVELRETGEGGCGGGKNEEVDRATLPATLGTKDVRV